MGPIACAYWFDLLVRLRDLSVDIVLNPVDFKDRDEAPGPIGPVVFAKLFL